MNRIGSRAGRFSRSAVFAATFFASGLAAPAAQEAPEDPPPTTDRAQAAEPEAAPIAALLAQHGSEAATASVSDPPFTYVQPTGPQQELRPTVDQATGALRYQHPLRLPPGRLGMAPTLALAYSSQSAQEENVVGYGWSLTIPYIERDNLHGSDTFYTGTSTEFTSYPWGPLSQIGGTAYGQKIQDGERLSFAYTGGTGSSWTLTTLNGTAHSFGALSGPDGGQQSDPIYQSDVFRWYLEQSSDTRGNTVVYTYTHSDGQVYPATITYTGAADGSAPLFRVEFLYDDPRPDTITSSARGFLVTTTRRLREVHIVRTDTAALLMRYELGYVQDARNKRSLLASITEIGYDDAGVPTSLPPTSFSYTADNFAFNKVWVNETAIWTDVHSFGVTFADVNGDAWPDAIKAAKFNIPPFGEVRETRRQDGAQAVAGGYDWPYLSPPLATWVPPKVFCTVEPGPNGVPYADAQGTAVVDVSGDALSDFVFADSNASPFNPQSSQVYVNTGTDWPLDHVWDGTVQPLDPVYTGYRPQLGDVNGDGLIDQIQILGGFVFDTNVWKNTGSAFSLISFGAGIFNGTGIRAVDFNHDGRSDLVQSSDMAGRFLLPNTGKAFPLVGTSFGGFTLPSNITLFETQSGGVKQAVFADVTGDHLPDFIDASGSLWYHVGNTWEKTDLGVSIDPDSVVDLNADGLPDIIINPCNDTPCSGTWVYYGAGTVPDLLERVTLPTGGVLDIAYKSSARYLEGGNLANPKLPLVVMTVEAVTETDPVNGTAGTTTYAYAGGSYYFANAFDRRFAGFERVTETRPDGSKVITYAHQGNGANASLLEPLDQQSLIGRVYRADELQGGSLLRRTMTQWAYDSLPSVAGGRYFVRPATATVEALDGNGIARTRAETMAYDASLGWRTGVTDHGEVTAPTPPFFADSVADGVIERTFGHTDPGNGLVLPTVDEMREDGTLVAKRVRAYDDLGNLTSVEDWITVGGAEKAITGYAHDLYGHVVTETDANGHATTYDFDAFNLYPETVTNALGHQTTYVYDYTRGQPKQVTDPNGEVQETDFDGLDRVVAERKPFPSLRILTTTRTVSYTDTPGAPSATETVYFQTWLPVEAITYFDGFGRTIQRRARAEDQAGVPTYAVTDTEYDGKGRIAQASFPYFSAGSARTPASTEAALYTIFSYDGLDRVTGETTVIGTTLSTYDDWETTVTDPLGHMKVFERDARDRLVRVDEHEGSTTFTTRYTYTALENLTRITDALGSIRNFAYDALGRRLLAEDLHAPSDTTFGVYSFEYDAMGNLTQKTTPNGDVIVYTYDELDRLYWEDYQGSPGVEVAFTYDVCPGGKGRLCFVTNETATIAREYDLQGNVSKETKTIAGVPYTTFYGRDLQGNDRFITNPDGSLIEYERNIAGLVERVYFSENGDPSPTAVVPNIDYAPISAPTVEANANGTTSVWTYDSAELYRLREHRLDTGSGTILGMTYGYDAVGNVLSIIESSPAGTTTKSYGYDELDRLTSAVVSAPDPDASYSESYAYDPLGSMLSGPAGSYLYEGNQGNSYANPHASTSIGSNPVSYDRNGNVLMDGSHANTWNYRGQLVKTAKLPGTPGPGSGSGGGSITIGPGGFTASAQGAAITKPHVLAATFYDYDSEGNRVSVAAGGIVTAYPTATFNTDDTKVTRHVFVNGRAAVTVEEEQSGAQGFWNFTDHLGSTRVVTNTGGEVVESLDYTPYGRQLGATGEHVEQQKFTGHESDASTGYTYAKARYLDHAGARFISQDAAFMLIGDAAFATHTGSSLQSILSDPQLLNSHAYARNGPLKLVDKTGDFPILAALALGAAGGVIVQYRADLVANRDAGLSGAALFLTLSSPKEYAIAAGKGVVVVGAGLIAGTQAALATAFVVPVVIEAVAKGTITSTSVEEGLGGMVSTGIGLGAINAAKVPIGLKGVEPIKQGIGTSIELLLQALADLQKLVTQYVNDGKGTAKQ